MAKKQTGSPVKERPDAAERYYELRSRAVDDLIDAQAGKTSAYSDEELKKYRAKKGFRLPEWIKIVVIKAWFAGAVCFFIFWGLGIYVTALPDMLLLIGIALGFVTDLLTNNALRFIEKRPGEHARWMMFPKKSYLSLVLNVVYSFLILYCVYGFYGVVNTAIVSLTGKTDSVPLGVEPLLFGILCMVFDLAAVGVKQLFLRIVRDARSSVEKQR